MLDFGLIALETPSSNMVLAIVARRSNLGGNISSSFVHCDSSSVDDHRHERQVINLIDGMTHNGDSS
jgi:hypothetical protein